MNKQEIEDAFPPSVNYLPIGCGWDQVARAIVGGAVLYIFNRNRNRIVAAATFGARVETRILATFREKFDPNQRIEQDFLNEHGQEIRDILHAAIKSEVTGSFTSDEWIRLLCYAMPVLRSVPYETQVQPDCKVVGNLARSVIEHVFPKAEDEREAERFYRWMIAVIYERLGLALLPLSNSQGKGEKRHSQAVRHTLSLARDNICALLDHKDLDPGVREKISKTIAVACEHFGQEFEMDNGQADPTRERISWAERQSEEIARQFARSITINLCGVVPGDKSTGMVDAEIEKRLFLRIKKHLRGSVLDATENPQIHNESLIPSYEASLRALREEDISAINDSVTWVRYALTAAGLESSLHVLRSKKSMAKKQAFKIFFMITEDLFRVFGAAFFPEANEAEMEELTRWLTESNCEVLFDQMRSGKDIKGGKEFKERFPQDFLGDKFLHKFEVAFKHDELSQSIVRDIKERKIKAAKCLLREASRMIAESDS